MNKGQATIGLLTAFSAVALFTLGWLGWTSMKTIDTAEQTATIIEWQKNTDENLKEYKDETSIRLEEVAKSNLQIQIDIATIKEFTRLLSLKSKIDTSAVEQRVLQNINNEDDMFSSTTARSK